MRRIIEKAKEIREKYGSDDLDFVAGKLGAEIVEHSLGRIIKEAYFKDLGVIVIHKKFLGGNGSHKCHL